MGSTYFRDKICDGEPDDDDSEAEEEKMAEVMFTSAKSAIVKCLLFEVQELKVACNPKYIRI